MSLISAILVAAGRGTRMGPNVDKLFLEVAGKPVIAHTWARLNALPEIDEIILVIREEMRADFDKIAVTHNFEKKFRYAIGGAERQDSVWNGLNQISDQAEIVAIQDGARPCTVPKLFTDCIAAAREVGASVAAQKVTDTLKEADEQKRIARNVDRSKLWAVQTPQVFRPAIIRKALAEVFSRGLVLTDDTAACELIGQPVALVESDSPNPKVTTPADLPFVELLLRTGRL